MAAVLVREIARGPAQPATDVEQPHSAANAELRGKRDRRLPAADVEFVDGGEVGGGEMVHVLARGRKRFQYRAPQRSMGVVTGNGFFHAHRLVPMGRIRADARVPGALHYALVYLDRAK